MDNNFDTICAICTPLATSSIGIIRISGADAFKIASEIFTNKIIDRKICYGHIINAGETIDEVIVLPFKAPKSYTGEDIIEIQAHGSYVILNEILNLIISKGARLAQKGEFTKRAFLNKRIDLSQAEAVLDLINSKSTKSAECALNNLEGFLKTKIYDIKNELINLYSKLIASVDFPEDVTEVDINCIVTICNDNIQKINSVIKNSKSHNFIRDGINICLIGKPNVGKSSLFNTLLNYNRAIVTEIEGTTRDTIRESLNIEGYLVNFVDTAGIRDKNKADKVEKIGIDNSIETIKLSEIVIFLFDKDKSEIDENLLKLADDKKVIFVKTKYDKHLTPSLTDDITDVSAHTGYGIDKLKQIITDYVKQYTVQDTNYTTNLRQQTLLVRCKEQLENVINTAESVGLADLCASDLKLAIISLDEITGEVLTDNILDDIFANFCIGK